MVLASKKGQCGSHPLDRCLKIKLLKDNVKPYQYVAEWNPVVSGRKDGRGKLKTLKQVWMRDI